MRATQNESNRRALALFAAAVFLTASAVSNLVVAGNVSADDAITISDCDELRLIGNDELYPLDGNYILTDNVDCGPQAEQIFYREDFEGDVRGWTSDGTGNSWHITNTTCEREDTPGSPFSFDSKVYGTNGNAGTDCLGGNTEGSYLASPAIELPAATNRLVLTFDSWAYDEGGACVDSGAYDSKSVIVVYGPEESAVLNDCEPLHPFVAGDGVISSSTLDYSRQVFDITDFAEEEIQIVFQYDTDDDCCEEELGWFVDNITLYDGELVSPIGDEYNPFTGTLNGQGHTIDNVTVPYQDNRFSGLFGVADGATVSNVTLQHLRINGTLDSDTDEVYSLAFPTGGLVGYGLDVTISNVTADGKVKGTENVGGIIGRADGDSSITDVTSNVIVYGGSDVGGLAGEVDGETTITGSISTGIITADESLGGLVGYLGGDSTIDDSHSSSRIRGEAAAGGLVGSNDGEINNSYATGKVDASDWMVGGLVGESGGSISNSYATGEVYGGGYTGGLAGGNYGSVEDSYAAGAVDGDNIIGGFAGENNGDISRSYSTGDVDAENTVGGFVGQNSSSGSIDQAYATGMVELDLFASAGGFVGENSGDISNAYARGDVEADEELDEDANNGIGGFVGTMSTGTVENSYTTSGVSSNTTELTGAFVGSLQNVGSPQIINSFYDSQTTDIATAAGPESDLSGGTGKNTSQMKTKATYTTELGEGTWNFSSIWTINAALNDKYPTFQWSDAFDYNGDGTPDNQQSNVTSLSNTITGKIVAIEVDEACEVNEFSAQAESSNTAQDSGYDYAQGLVNFTADCGTPGYTTTVKIFYYGVGAEHLVLRKHNPNTNAYFTVSGATLEETAINEQQATIASYQVTDGGDLDTDSNANGTIIDPVGLAQSVVGVPNTGFERL